MAIKLTTYLTIDCEADNNEVPFITTICNTNLEAELIYPRSIKGHDRIKQICENPKIQKIFHSATSDINFLSNVGIQVLPPYHDTLIMASLVDENFAKRNLKVLTMRYLDDPCPDYQELKKVKAALKRQAKKEGRIFGWQDIPKEVIEPYAIQDAVRTMKLFYVFKDTVFKKYHRLYNMELDLIPIIHRMKKRGMLVDRDFCKREIQKLEEQYRYFYNKIIKSTKKLWNIHSTQQVLQYIENKNIYVEAKTPKGNPSVNAKTLDLLSREYPVFKHIQYCRKALKQISTYYEPLLIRYTTNEDPVARFDLYQTGTRTGRFSAELIQTAPRQKSKGEIQNNVRAAFITRPGYVNLYFDYSNIEMRLFIHFINHKKLIEAVKQGVDIHQDTAINLFGKEKAEADPEYRQKAKCFHPDTEVLSKKGWIKLKDLKQGEEIIQAIPINKQGIKLEWTSNYNISLDQNHFDTLVHLKNNGFDLMVTPDHRILGETLRGNYLVGTPNDINNSRYIPNAGILNNESKLDISDDLLRLVVAVQADGRFKTNQIDLNFVKERKIKRLRTILVNFKNNYKESISRSPLYKKPITRFYLRKVLADKIKKFLAPDKTFTYDLLNLDSRQRKIFIEELQYWDGSKHKTMLSHRYCSTIIKNLDIVQAICAISERKSCLYEHAGLRHYLSILVQKKTRGYGVNTKILKYKKDIALLSVPSTFVLVRYNGKTCITGQTINFGIIYGMGKAALANALDLPMMEAYKVIKDYYRKYPVKEFMDKIMKEIQQTGKLKVKWIGRSYNIPINMAYKGVNALIQGSAAYVLKLALLRVDKYLRSEVLGANILLQMHDELIIEVPDNYNVHEVAKRIKECMEDHESFRVPITVDTKFSVTSWQDKQKWK